MIKILIILLALILAVAFFIESGITGFISVKGFDEFKNKTIGHCPSMKEYAIENYDANFIEFSSTYAALEQLKNGMIDYALIGRMPLDSEFTGDCKMLEEGFTLVSSEKKFIDYSEIKNLRIHTHLSKSIAEDFLPEAKNIFFHESLNESLEYLNETVLIDWKDYDNYGLGVPYFNGNKVMKFRIPVICKK